jgi:hypothetical protein
MKILVLVFIRKTSAFFAESCQDDRKTKICMAQRQIRESEEDALRFASFCMSSYISLHSVKTASIMSLNFMHLSKK